MRICINIFNCTNCGARWIVRWTPLSFSTCQKCRSISSDSEFKVINTDHKGIKRVQSKARTINAQYRCPETNIVEFLPYK